MLHVNCDTARKLNLSIIIGAFAQKKVKKNLLNIKEHLL
jgi:hypothetical protein